MTEAKDPNSNYGLATKAIHAGQGADPSTGALSTPIFQAATFLQEELGKDKGFTYGRAGNPTRSALEECLAQIEGGRFGLAFASGIAAASTVMNLLSAGDHVVCGENIYPGVYRLFEQVFRRYNIDFTYVPAANSDAVEEAIKPNTKLLWVETPTNPLLQLADLQALGEIANRRALILVVDNTFATPCLQRPLQLGASIVLQSTTKYIGGHADVVGGALITSDADIYERLKFHQLAVGAIPGPFDCFLILRGVNTLALRMREHCRNGLAVAEFLEGHPAVEKVYYPGLKSHPQHELAKRQMNGFGGVVSLLLKGGFKEVNTVVSGTKLFKLTESLGGAKSMIRHPATMTTTPLPKEVREKFGIADNFIRLSVGLEDTKDLLADLEAALSLITPSTDLPKESPVLVA
jgi:cystathionine gamma-lyase